MRAVKIAVGLLVAYVVLVVGFESLIGYLQPTGGGGETIVITTFAADGTGHDRVVSKLEADGKLYVAANHWPRAWYTRALEKPEMQVTIDGQKRDVLAVPVSGEEHERVSGAHPLPAFFRILTGFPPRYFVRLDPRS